MNHSLHFNPTTPCDCAACTRPTLFAPYECETTATWHETVARLDDILCGIIRTTGPLVLTRSIGWPSHRVWIISAPSDFDIWSLFSEVDVDQVLANPRLVSLVINGDGTGNITIGANTFTSHPVRRDIAALAETMRPASEGLTAWREPAWVLDCDPPTIDRLHAVAARHVRVGDRLEWRDLATHR
ncbi:hypothetical protein EHW97_05120 [Aeromicrobium camelliae]|uniref:Uncharacterized protein n=1 Tax=Aeromicrobium camelliae TaxID=1538144 RepID=A0A3N6WVP1_9ACTN|nr:hypothetical protein [Aeromicrobium camelliae]RQN09072.1 hypothetical protein EHW97_05120 [Aeromicrobium camelliae]